MKVYTSTQTLFSTTHILIKKLIACEEVRHYVGYNSEYERNPYIPNLKTILGSSQKETD